MGRLIDTTFAIIVWAPISLIRYVAMICRGVNESLVDSFKITYDGLFKGKYIK